MGETKPRQLSCVPSVAYSEFRADFLEIDSDSTVSILPIGWAETDKIWLRRTDKSSMEARMSLIIMGLGFNLAIAELGRCYQGLCT